MKNDPSDPYVYMAFFEKFFDTDQVFSRVGMLSRTPYLCMQYDGKFWVL